MDNEEDGEMELGAKREGEERKLVKMRVLCAHLSGVEMKLVGIIYLLLIIMERDTDVGEG
jgi:hypothetical protein